jgi:magnesium transporter
MMKFNQSMTRETEFKTLLLLLRNNQVDVFRKMFFTLHYYEQGEFYITLAEEDKVLLYHVLSPSEVAEFFVTLEIPEDEYEEIFNQLDENYAAAMFEAMQYDNAADVMSELPKDKMDALLTLMQKGNARHIRHLLNFDEDTAGGIMNPQFISINAEMSVREAMHYLKKVASDSETIYYVFVVDYNNRLMGTVSLRELIVSEDDEYIEDIMQNRMISIRVSDDQEKAVKLVRDYNLLALPVLDDYQHLVGIITVDDIMDVIDEEASEDYSRLAGMSDTEHTTDSSLKIAKKRLPWLVGLTFMGMITATMLTTFEDTLEQVAILGAFIPIIGGMAGNTGTQSLAVAVRGISSGEIKQKSKLFLSLREAGSGVITGFICGLILFGIITIFFHEPLVGLIVSISLMVAMIIATLTGTLVPLIMNRFGIDPAVASGPFITTGNDIISLLIYFSLANMFMSALL